MLIRLKNHQKQLYFKFKCWLWTSLILLTLPLTFRSLFLLFDETWSQLNNWLLNSEKPIHETIYNSVFLITTTWLPLIMQNASLVFGLVRQKQSEQESSPDY